MAERDMERERERKRERESLKGGSFNLKVKEVKGIILLTRCFSRQLE